MASRTTGKTLEALVRQANEILGFKDAGANPFGAKFIGALFLYGAYGGYGVHRVQSEGGSMDCLLGIGTAKECAEWLRGFMWGVRVARDGK